jgi:ABC-2 type transport system permease protein
VNRICRIPSVVLPDPLGALVEKELRTLIRTPRFRLVFIMGFSFGLIVWLPLALGRREGDSMLANNFLTVVSVYALTLLGQVSYWNAFGFDRAAAQVYFSLPVPISRTLAGKNIAAATFIFLEMAAVSTACLLLRFKLPPFKILEAFLVTPVVGLYLLALGNLSSIHYPRAMNPERVAQGGAASRFQALMFLLYPIAMLPVFLAYLARYAFGSQLIFYLMLAFAALLGGVIYWIAMDSAVSAAYRRRELLLTELSRSEGPVVTE